MGRRARLDGIDATVVVCAYTEARWEDLTRGVAALERQTVPPKQIVLIVDHNPGLLERARAAFARIEVKASSEARGLSGARNSGVAVARGEIVAFLDDDAEPADDWLEQLTTPFAKPSVIGAGGGARPRWPAERPSWFPPEFDWVVGCSYHGLPGAGAAIRNPIGAAMAFRRSAFAAAGGFTEGIGRVGTVPLGCEETEFSIRVARAVPGTTIVHAPDAVVHHRVSDDRVAYRYFVRRCYAEGMSKRVVSRLVGRHSALASERGYVLRTIPAGLRRDLGTPGARRRAATTLLGLAAAGAGYLRAGLSRARPVADDTS